MPACALPLATNTQATTSVSSNTTSILSPLDTASATSSAVAAATEFAPIERPKKEETTHTEVTTLPRFGLLRENRPGLKPALTHKEGPIPIQTSFPFSFLRKATTCVAQA